MRRVPVISATFGLVSFIFCMKRPHYSARFNDILCLSVSVLLCIISSIERNTKRCKTITHQSAQDKCVNASESVNTSSKTVGASIYLVTCCIKRRP